MKTRGFDLFPASDSTVCMTLSRGNTAPAAELFTTFTQNKGIKL